VITDDVNEGRRHMNFEDWEALADPKQANDRPPAFVKKSSKGACRPFHIAWPKRIRD
jgi:hypothetical protein